MHKKPFKSGKISILNLGINLHMFMFYHSQSTPNVAVIFTARPTLWDLEFAKQLSQSSNQMPCNKLEEMIQWTKDGKMWQYPINNEDGE